MIVGDFTASLPRCRTDLTSNWSRVRPFNKNSQMLLDWIDDNQLEISNFNFSQSLNYTYVKGTHKTYIDHILASEQANQWITDCTIISNDPECTSDHFPIEVKLKIPDCPINKSKTPSEVYNVKEKVYRGISHYKNKIKVVFDELVTSDERVGLNNAQSYVDGYCSDITSSIHKATEQALMMLPKQKCVRPIRKHWWSQSFKEAKTRHKFWLSLWNDCKRPREGVVYETYKATKYNYRKACRNAFNHSAKMNFKTCRRLLKNKHTKAFMILESDKKAKNRDKNNNYSDISLTDLEEHYSKKFMYDENEESDTVKSARVDVENKLEALKSVFSAFNITIANLRDCLKYLKKGRAAGKDGLVTEHLLYGSDSLLYIHLCKLLSICFQYGVVPSIFRQGILVPILKIPTLDDSCAKHFRPVIMSTVFSK